ncbi:MAG: flagellar basal body rod protein FlgB, partial [Lachnospiraceae bacterium]|nr:flagellar basal body rod protein FlgB [Lachnospiraceae bacterium]
MISSGAYNYINVLQQATDASWLRNTIISNNIANVDTPNYKRQDVQFETYLIEQLAG